MILALDTSSAIAVAVVAGSLGHDAGPTAGDVLAANSEFAPRSHAEHLATMVRECLAAAGATSTDVSSIVVGTGPAPFTGLRVGLVTARTLGFAWSVPVLGICSLDAIGAAHGGDCTVIADARRHEVYWAPYSAGLRTAPPQVGAPATVGSHGPMIGRGAALFPAVFESAAIGDLDSALIDPAPEWLVRVAARRIAAGESDFATEPLYLRRPDVHGAPHS